MARVEADRDDLMREAVALARRMEFQAKGEEQAIVVGFRPSGWLSIYFGQDVMYQFDELGRLRRAFLDGLLYRTQGICLAQLRRQRSETEINLIRRDLSGEALTAFRNQSHDRIRWLRSMFSEGEITVTRQVPPDDMSLVHDLIQFLGGILDSSVFLAPAIKR